MKLPSSLAALAVAAALALALAVFLGERPVVRAQTNVCTTNPSPAKPDFTVVTSPTSGQRVTSPIQVTGQASVFEAVISLTLYGAGGAVITDIHGRTQEGQTLSPYSVAVPFTVSQETPACLWVYGRSGRDDSPINVVQVPVVLVPGAGSGGTWLNRPPSAAGSQSTCPQNNQWLLLYWSGSGQPIDNASQACAGADRIWVSREGRWQGFSPVQKAASDAWTPLTGEAHFIHKAN